MGTGNSQFKCTWPTPWEIARLAVRDGVTTAFENTGESLHCGAEQHPAQRNSPGQTPAIGLIACVKSGEVRWRPVRIYSSAEIP